MNIIIHIVAMTFSSNNSVLICAFNASQNNCYSYILRLIFKLLTDREFNKLFICVCLYGVDCTKCRGATYEAKPCGGISDRQCIRE